MDTKEYVNFCHQPTLHIKNNGKVLLFLFNKFSKFQKLRVYVYNICLCSVCMCVCVEINDDEGCDMM